MNAIEFVQQCEVVFGNGRTKLSPNQIAVYIEKLQPFSDNQISAIYDKVLELTEHFPKPKNIYDAARELGYLQTHQDIFAPHRWEETDCRMCQGEGRLCVTWLVTFELTEETKREVHALSQIRPYSKSSGHYNFNLQKDEYRSLFRCSCLAGDVDTIPKGWPRWGKHMPAVRYV